LKEKKRLRWNILQQQLETGTRVVSKRIQSKVKATNQKKRNSLFLHSDKPKEKELTVFASPTHSLNLGVALPAPSSIRHQVSLCA
jgi:hypothetical protein